MHTNCATVALHLFVEVILGESLLFHQIVSLLSRVVEDERIAVLLDRLFHPDKRFWSSSSSQSPEPTILLRRDSTGPNCTYMKEPCTGVKSPN